MRARESDNRENPVAPGCAVAPPPTKVAILRHGRCQDCTNFERVEGGVHICHEGIGGSKVCWGTGEWQCDPAPDTWHYCAHYTGPRISRDVWVWKHRA